MFQLEPSRELEKCEQTEHALTGSETSSQPADEERREEVVVASTACSASHQEGQLYTQSAGGHTRLVLVLLTSFSRRITKEIIF